MKISFVVPVYNVEKYLRQCVDSLLGQTVAAHEIILVDDGSKDSSGAICDEYAAKHSCVKSVHKRNAGLGMARNTGMEHVTGDYVIFIDSDDFCQNDFVEQMTRIHGQTQCDTCKTSFNKVDMQGQFLSAHGITAGVFEGEAVRTGVLPRIIGSAPEKKDSIPASACCTLYSMDIIRKNNLWFVSERELISEDIIFNIAYYNLAQKVVLSEYIGYNYRTNPYSLTTTYLPDRFERCLVMYQKEVELLTELGLYELCRYRLIRQFFIYVKECFKRLYSPGSGLKPSDIRREIRRMCQEPQLQQMIRQYPVHKMGIKQQMFVYMIQYRMVYALYFANKP